MASINVRVDDELKKQSEMIFEELGMNTSTAINIFLKQVIRSNGIPFTVQADPFYSVENQAHLLQQKKEWKKAKGKFMMSLSGRMKKIWMMRLGKIIYIGKPRIEKPLSESIF